MKNIINNKCILITGGTGSFGQKFTEVILKKFNPKKIIIFSRDEFKQHKMALKFKKYEKILRFFLGDVRDLKRLILAFEDVHLIIHAAALKQVPAAEYNPFEFIKTNILGAQNIIEASLKTGVEKVLALSTDKAVTPINLYGATKLCSDKLFLAANNYVGKKKISFSVIRYGNVVGSRGSVIPFFKSIANKNVLPITDKKMTRFWITFEEAIDLVLWASNHSKGGEIFVPKIPSFRIIDLAKAINSKAKLEIVGVRPGEKIHEDLIVKSEASNLYDFGKYYCILNYNIKLKSKKYKIKNIKKVSSDFFYNSSLNSHFLDINQIKKRLLKY